MNFTLTTALVIYHTFGKYCGSDFYQLGSDSLQFLYDLIFTYSLFNNAGFILF